jgi:negative regulator of flagellin synthesis FlgM
MVNPVSFGTARPLGERQPSSAANAAAQSPAPTKPVPVAQLTAMARELADAPPPIDHAKIAQLRAAIANGSYRVDAIGVADALLRHYHPIPR